MFLRNKTAPIPNTKRNKNRQSHIAKTLNNQDIEIAAIPKAQMPKTKVP